MAKDLIDERAEKELSDSAERAAALDPARSFIVQAPAGSGKTALLIQRFLSLLVYVTRPEEVLAITFTRKAAAEMHERIFSSLLAAEAGEEGESENERIRLESARAVLLRSKELGWGLLENPARLQVLTIDSFCASLSRRMPLMSRLGSSLTVAEKPAGLYATAARRTVNLIDGTGAGAEAVRSVLLYHDNSIVDVEKKIVVMLAKREQWLRHTKSRADAEGLRGMLEGSVERLVTDKLSLVCALFPTHVGANFLELARYAAFNLNAASVKSPICDLLDLEKVPGASTDDLYLWKGVAELFITKSGGWRSPRGITRSVGFTADKTAEAKGRKEAFIELLGLLSTSAELLDAFVRVRSLPTATYSDEDWSTLRALLHLLPIAVKNLLQVFVEHRAVDFTEISMAAIDALGADDNPTDLMLSLDNTYSHILVDEYQDTSWTQVTLLRALTRGFTPGDGRTLFIVGDPMQSIYLFRDAEVGLFLEARANGIETVELVPLTLRSNFRSDGHIVEWVNRTFVKALPEVEDAQAGAVVYEASVPYLPTTKGAAVSVRLYAESSDVYKRREAGEIVEVLTELNYTETESTKAVLFRSRSHLSALVPALKRAGIDFKADELDPLYERPLIQDLFALTRALYHLADTAAWLSVLRARWCGLTLGELHSICFGERSRPVAQLIKDDERTGTLSNSARRRLARFSKEIDLALSLTGRVSPRDLIEGVWVALGGPACYAGDDSVTDAELFFDMIETVSEGAELSSIEALEERIEKLFAMHSGMGGNPVVLMTIHKAKGLEFDHVIVPGLGHRPPATDKKLLYWMERGDDLILAPIEKKNSAKDSLLYRYLVEVQKEKERLETARLFYVAATRAKKGLYLYGHVTNFKDESISVESASLLGTIEGSLCADMVAEPGGEEIEESTVAINDVKLKRLSESWVRPAPLPVAGTAKESIEVTTAKERLKYDWATVTASYIGTVVHGFFCTIAKEGLGKWNAGRLESERGRMEADLLTLGISKKELKRAVDKGLALVANALEDEKGRWVLGSFKNEKTEWALSGAVGAAGDNDEGRIEEIIIDRTFVDEENVCWIVDYKTGRHEGSSVEEFIAAERKRHSAQLEKYELILRRLGEQRKIKKALYYPALKRLVVL